MHVRWRNPQARFGQVDSRRTPRSPLAQSTANVARIDRLARLVRLVRLARIDIPIDSIASTLAGLGRNVRLDGPIRIDHFTRIDCPDRVERLSLPIGSW